MKRIMMIGFLPLLVLSGCVTTTPERAAAERASCEEMEKDMGLGTTHDHSAMKGMGANPMNLNHERCQQILSQPQ